MAPLRLQLFCLGGRWWTDFSSVSQCGFVLLLWTSGLIPHTTPEGCGDRWTLIFNVLISVFALSTVSLWRRPAACVRVFSTSRPLNKVSVGVRRQSVPGMQLSGEHYGIVGLAANRTKESSSHPSGLVYTVEDVHKRWERNFAGWVRRKMLPGKCRLFFLNKHSNQRCIFCTILQMFTRIDVKSQTCAEIALKHQLI